MSPFRSLREYETHVYTLRQRHSAIAGSTLVVIQRGAAMAVLRGDVYLPAGYRVTVREQLALDDGPVVIEDYGYEIWHGSEIVAWYDSQPHPTDSALASTHPHHKHVPPDIKHNRTPAPGLRFDRPNLDLLITEASSLAEGPH